MNHEILGQHTYLLQNKYNKICAKSIEKVLYDFYKKN